MIERLRLEQFKAFERFQVTFGPETYLVGPNNAGKSTLIAALRVAANMLRHAKRRQPEYDAEDGDRPVPAYAFGPGQFQLVDENLRHEFRQLETRLELVFRSGSRLVAVWPSPDEPDAESFFYLRTGDGVLVRRSAQAREHFPTLAVLPLLSPVEHQERVLDDTYVRENWSGRLASRHFRNQLRLLQTRQSSDDDERSELDDFLEWAEPWTPDFSIHSIDVRTTDRGRVMDVFCLEQGSHTEKELFWAGDGMQVWLQLLMHLWRNQGVDTVVLDEPDLYLHADLQRRLVRLLDDLSSQTVAASHSAEVLAEAAPQSITWITKERRRGVRAPDDRILTQLSSAIGSHFNIRLARALRAQAVLFVEGEDMKILRNFARTVGADELIRETKLVTVPLRGFSNWPQVEPFAWLVDQLLGSAVRAYVILDRDYRTDAQVQDVVARLRNVGVGCHVWRRKELESYVLDDDAIARASGADASDVGTRIADLAEEQRESVFARMLAERLVTEVDPQHHTVTVTEAAREAFDELWARADERLFRCDPKHLLRGLNQWLTDNGHRAVAARKLSAGMTLDEIPDEMTEALRHAQELIETHG